MDDPVYKKIQLVGTSTKSFSDAAANAIEKAGKTVHHIDRKSVV
jgi:flavin-binding protein dodecin